MADMPETPEVAAETETPDIEAKISEAVSKLEAKYQKQLDAAFAAQKETQKLEKMSDDERRQAEFETAKKELETKTLELKRREIELETSKVLNQRGIPITFMQYFITDDNAATLERIKAFEKEYKAAVETAVNEKLKGKPPAASTTKPTSNKNFLDAIKKNQVAR